jgi:hypothetical protein
MPKWSEMPWGTIITGIVALYGAVLSTTTLLVQRNRDRVASEEAQRRQAGQMTGWLVPYEGPEEAGRLFAGLALQNDSSQPVYDLIANVVRVSEGHAATAVGIGKEYRETGVSPHRFRTYITLVPPGRTIARIEHGGGGMHHRFGVEFAFQDAAGRYWLRKGNGILKAVSQHPLDLYGITGPAPWRAN